MAVHSGNPLEPVDRRRPPNALALACIAIFLVLLGGQILTGWRDHDKEARAHHQHGIGLAQYLTTGHFYEATFENWESEFLQAAAYVVLTIWLVQLGSAESKDPDGDAVDEDPRRHRDDPDAPWPVRRGGVWLRLYENSLLVAFVVLFLGAVVGHALGGTAEFNAEARQHHEAADLHARVRPDELLLVPVVPELAERVPRRRRDRRPQRGAPPTRLRAVEAGRGAEFRHRIGLSSAGDPADHLDRGGT